MNVCATGNVTYLFMALKVYCCTTGNKHKILRDSSILSLSLLTCVVLVPLEDRSEQAMNDDRCDYCAQHEHDDSCCFHPLWRISSRSDEGLERCLGREEGTEPEGAPRFLWSVMSQPTSRLPLPLSATCGTAYDALMSPLFSGATQILKSSKNFENNGSKPQGP